MDERVPPTELRLSRAFEICGELQEAEISEFQISEHGYPIVPPESLTELSPLIYQRGRKEGTTDRWTDFWKMYWGTEITTGARVNVRKN